MDFNKLSFHIRRGFRRRRAACVLGVAAFSFLVTAVCGKLFPPQPSNMDEFSVLLSADTFAHGRLTNAPHPMWKHFESLHIIQQPSYTSKYMPGPALVLGASQHLFGEPIVGLWITTALACGALTWMMMAWMPAEWAVLGGTIALFSPLIGQWSRFYLNCNLAVLGGALLIGAFRRLLRKRTIGSSVLLGLGVSILALTRPYEGAVLSLLVAAWFLVEAKRGDFWPALRKTALPASVLVVGALLFVGYYNWRVTGNAATFAYSVYQKEYAQAPVFWLQTAGPATAVIRHPWLTEFDGWEYWCYATQRSARGFFEFLWNDKLSRLWQHGKSILLLGFLGLPVVLLRSRLNRRATIIYALWFLLLLLPCWLNHNYTAPGFALLFLLLVQSMRALAQWQVFRWPVGALIVAASVTLCIANRHVLTGPPNFQPSLYGYDRAKVIQELKDVPGEHLVLIRYGPEHNRAAEWIYNEADIDTARIVWARDLGTDGNRDLLAYFRNRRVWLLNPDNTQLTLEAYNAAPVASESSRRSSRSRIRKSRAVLRPAQEIPDKE